MNTILLECMVTVQMYNAEGTDEFIILHNKTLTSKTTVKQ